MKVTLLFLVIGLAIACALPVEEAAPSAAVPLQVVSINDGPIEEGLETAESANPHYRGGWGGYGGGWGGHRGYGGHGGWGGGYGGGWGGHRGGYGGYWG